MAIRAVAKRAAIRSGLLPTVRLLKRDLPLIGWSRSARLQVPVDGSGAPLPWLTYSAIRFLEARVGPAMDVFEFGAGNSTLWWAKRVQSVTAVEHDPAWYQKIVGSLPPNASCELRALSPVDSYSTAPNDADRHFDVIVIDGMERLKCANSSLGALKPDGVVIWDNSDRDDFKQGLAMFKDQGFREITFTGFGPINTYTWSTSILYRRRENCFSI